MKNTALVSMFLLLLMGTLNVANLQAQTMPEMVSIREINLKEGASLVHFHNTFQIAAEQVEELSKGMGVGLWVGDRGGRKGEMLHTYFFDLKANRDYYFPNPGEGSPKMNALGAKIQMPNGENLTDFVEGTETYTDYAVLGFYDMVDPKGGPVASLHEVEVPVENHAAFETLVIEKLQPAWQEKVEGMYIYVLKGDRGERKGKYLISMVFDSIQRRDAYFPTEGEGGSEALEAISDGIWFDTEMENLGVSQLGVYTDYLFVY